MSKHPKRRGFMTNMAPPPEPTAEELERFWAKVEKPVDQSRLHKDCWTWAGARGNRGYGRHSLRGRSYLAHRLAKFFATCRRVNGRWIAGQWTKTVHHTCKRGRFACVSPFHIRDGRSMDENRPDTRRRRYGLTDDQLAVIFDMREDGKSFKQIIAATVADDPAASGGAIIRALSPQPPKYVMKYLKSRKVKA